MAVGRDGAPSSDRSHSEGGCAVPGRRQPAGRRLCVQKRGSLGGLQDFWPPSVRLAPDADVPAGRPYLLAARLPARCIDFDYLPELSRS